MNPLNQEILQEKRFNNNKELRRHNRDEMKLKKRNL